MCLPRRSTPLFLWREIYFSLYLGLDFSFFFFYIRESVQSKGQNLNQIFPEKKREKETTKERKNNPKFGSLFPFPIPWLLFICCSSAFQAIWPGSEADFLKHIVVWKAALEGFLATNLRARWVGNLQLELILKDFHSNAEGKLRALENGHTHVSGSLWMLMVKRELSSSSIKVTPLWLDHYLHGSHFALQRPLAVLDTSPSLCSMFLTAKPNLPRGTTPVPCMLLKEVRTQGSGSQIFLVHNRVWEFPEMLYLTQVSWNLSVALQSGGGGVEIKNRTLCARSGILADNACMERPPNRQQGSPARLHSLYKQLFILLSLFETDYAAEDFWKNLFHLTTIFGNIRYRIEMRVLAFIYLSSSQRLQMRRKMH